ncbi:MAG TPA: hypothetical protein VED01_12960 [Burkholderiales bacterium]|nr:hypothetical protein [Burkholderiales bacterium]
MQFLDPRNPQPPKHVAVPRVESLRGARIAFLNNGWLSMRRIGERVRAPLRERYGVAEVCYYDVPRNTEPPGGLLNRVAQEFDAAIVGLAN